MHIVLNILTYIDGFVIRDKKPLIVKSIEKMDWRYNVLDILFSQREIYKNEYMPDMGYMDTRILVLPITRNKEYILRVYEDEFSYIGEPDVTHNVFVREFSFFRSMRNEELLCDY